MKRILYFLIVPALLLGCKPGPTQPEKAPNIEGGLRKTFPVLDRTLTMEQLRNLSVGFQATPGVVPKTIEELEQVHSDPKLTIAIKDGAIVVVLGVNPERQPPDALLAYQAEPDQNGERVVLKCNGQVTVMDAKTFEAAPKAKTR
jgi:hypothetical protein